jgi:hypothetical protein
MAIIITISRYLDIHLSIVLGFVIFLSHFVIVWVWEQFLKNGFLLALIAVVYLQQWLKNKPEYVQCAKAGIGIL